MEGEGLVPPLHHSNAERIRPRPKKMTPPAPPSWPISTRATRRPCSNRCSARRTSSICHAGVAGRGHAADRRARLWPAAPCLPDDRPQTERRRPHRRHRGGCRSPSTRPATTSWPSSSTPDWPSNTSGFSSTWFSSGITPLNLYGEQKGKVWDTGALDAYNQYAYPVGTYTISAESILNKMKDNYKQGGADYTGKTVSQCLHRHPCL